MINRKPREEEYEIVKADVLIKNLVFKHGVNPDEGIDFSDLQYPIVIKGDIGAGAYVKTKYNLTIEGSTQARVTLEAENGYIKVNDIGAETSITAKGDIKAATIGDNVTLRAGGDIHVKDVGENCILISLHGSVYAGNIGKETTIESKGNIKTKNVSESAVITAGLELTVADVSKNAKLSAQCDIHFNNINPSVTLNTKKGMLLQQAGMAGAYNEYRPAPTRWTLPANPSASASTMFYRQSGTRLNITFTGTAESITTSISNFDNPGFTDIIVSAPGKDAKLTLTDINTPNATPKP